MSTRIVVGQGSCGLAAGAGAVYSALELGILIFVFKFNAIIWNAGRKLPHIKLYKIFTILTSPKRKNKHSSRLS